MTSSDPDDDLKVEVGDLLTSRAFIPHAVVWRVETIGEGENGRVRMRSAATKDSQSVPKSALGRYRRAFPHEADAALREFARWDEEGEEERREEEARRNRGANKLRRSRRQMGLMR